MRGDCPCPIELDHLPQASKGSVHLSVSACRAQQLNVGNQSVARMRVLEFCWRLLRLTPAPRTGTTFLSHRLAHRVCLLPRRAELQAPMAEIVFFPGPPLSELKTISVSFKMLSSLNRPVTVVAYRFVQDAHHRGLQSVVVVCSRLSWCTAPRSCPASDLLRRMNVLEGQVEEERCFVG